MLQSSFWSYNSIALVSEGEACLFDPGGRPADIEALARAARADLRRVTHVVVTHSHHDHLRGWHAFPEARLWLPAAAAHKDEAHKERDLDFQRVIDERLGAEDVERHFPSGEGVFEERAHFRVGAHEVELRFLPGHSLCTSVAFVPAERALISADYLVSPGLPYCRWRPRVFEEALVTLDAWCRELRIERVLPAHNDPIEGTDAVLAAIEEEAAYFRHLRRVACELLDEGRDPGTATRLAARAMRVRRGAPAGAGERQDGDNARRVVKEEHASRAESDRDRDRRFS